MVHLVCFTSHPLGNLGLCGLEKKDIREFKSADSLLKGKILDMYQPKQLKYIFINSLRFVCITFYNLFVNLFPLVLPIAES